MSRTDVAIIGAGPYGLSLAGHLARRGIAFRIFGRPMDFWQRIADAAHGRFLKSFGIGANILLPGVDGGFAEWSRSQGLEAFEPCEIKDFAAYGQWVQNVGVPMLESNSVAWIRRINRGFQLFLDSGEAVEADRAVLATGLSSFERVPAELAKLPTSLATHSNGVTKFTVFRGRRVAVIGSGQSALEAAALLHEAGAAPHLIVRQREIRWMSRLPRHRSIVQRFRSPISGLGAGPKAWLLTSFPAACRRLPERPRVAILRYHLPPEGAWWLRSRVEGIVPTLLDARIIGARESGGEVMLELEPGDAPPTSMPFDHVIAATGFHVDIDRLGFIDPDLRRSVRRICGSPWLDHRFQSSVPGLFFIGPAAAMSFGPLYRFVIGAEYAAPTVAAELDRKASKRIA